MLGRDEMLVSIGEGLGTGYMAQQNQVYTIPIPFPHRFEFNCTKFSAVLTPQNRLKSYHFLSGPATFFAYLEPK